ncbi:ABC transporter permease [Jatrophihabitans cynanchi]|jgi:ribose transport system permease protein|uniref:ABC transporter permease n=1 Tax=Jatrophihabitans cynanchi TaxID=2944128 RepID=A0ABY7K0Z4_9ACTN|nr:ABC transporter permease [Jatrophihabitans sp. SB3-54]WAX58339.1 ABC transporter permease [Jatrophihabitans sp. SB3-54]
MKSESSLDSPGHEAPVEQQREADHTGGSRTNSEPVAPTRKVVSSLGLHRLVIFVPWALMIAIFAGLRPHTFWTTGTVQAILNSQSSLVILAIAIVPTLVVGDYDLSVAANSGLVSTIVATVTVMDGWPLWAGIVLAVAAACAVGVVNAVLVVVLNLNSIIMTLGMATLLDGVALAVSNSQTLSGVSSGFTDAFTHLYFGIQISVLYIIVVALVVAYVLQASPIGRQMTFAGQSRAAAVLVGIKTHRIRLGAYLAGSLLAALSGIVALASQGGISPGLSETQLLPAFAAAFFSTVVFTIGRFNAWGTVAAIYFLTTGIVGLQILGATGWAADVFYGAALVLAVAGFTLVRRRLTGSKD